MQYLDHFEPLARAYEGFIIDLWGVIHDGVTPFQDALDCLRHLRASGKPYVLLSNAPRRAHVAQAGMTAIGIDPALTLMTLTSGEQTWRMLRDRDDPYFAALGDRVLHLGPDRDRSLMEDLALTSVNNPEDASFVLNTGPDDEGGPVEADAYDNLLAACRRCRLPMICANPDLVVIRGGRQVICAGTLAQRYEAMGAVVRWIGKPDPAIYEPALGMLGLARHQVLAIGDALRTDMAGAKAAQIASCWALDGIHAASLGGHPSARAAEAAALAASEGLAPDAAMERFVW